MKKQYQIIICLACFLMLIVGCGGIHEYRLGNIPKFSYDKKLPGSITCQVSAENVYNHTVGLHTYKLYLRDAVAKEYKKLLGECFQNGYKEKNGDYILILSVQNSSIFPIYGLIINVWFTLKVEIFNSKMEKQKTIVLNAFGTDKEGSKALSKAIFNSFTILLPHLEEIFGS